MLTLCKGKTSKGKDCRNKMREGSYCYCHKNQEVDDKGKAEVEEESEEETLEECSICLDEKNVKEFIILSCKHKLCIECSQKLEKSVCPFCRCDISKEVSSKKKVEDKLSCDELIAIFGPVQAFQLAIQNYSRDELENNRVRFVTANGIDLFRLFFSIRDG